MSSRLRSCRLYCTDLLEKWDVQAGTTRYKTGPTTLVINMRIRAINILKHIEWISCIANSANYFMMIFITYNVFKWFKERCRSIIEAFDIMNLFLNKTWWRSVKHSFRSVWGVSGPSRHAASMELSIRNKKLSRIDMDTHTTWTRNGHV